jgi:hypothetical protein
MNPIIVINVNMGSKGHQIGRLISSCDNVAWYDHVDNGTHPWEPCSNILNAELSPYHYDRRFADNTTVPPVLDYARRSGLPERPELTYKSQLLTYITHGDLDEAHDYFNGNHLVVLHKDLDRFMKTTWNFKVGKTKTPISELYRSKEVVEKMLDDTLVSYETNITDNDFIIESIEDLLKVDIFKSLCSKFNLGFNEDKYTRVKKFLTQ